MRSYKYEVQLVFFSFIALICFFKMANARTNYYGDTYTIPSVWRTSVTVTPDNLVSITTQPVDFGGVIVTSACPGSCLVGIFDGSNNIVMSTINANAVNSFPYGYGILGASTTFTGLKYTNFTAGASTANITILWQYKYKADAGR